MRILSPIDFLSLSLVKEAQLKIRAVEEQLQVRSSMKSFHEELLVALSMTLLSTQKTVDILEIGTYDGVNALILASLDPRVRVVTLDIKPQDPRSYGTYCDVRKSTPEKWQSEHYETRLENVSHPNIVYHESPSSCFLLSNLSNRLWDIFWIDGDHRFPQVAIDAASAISSYRINPGLSIVFDDILPQESNPVYATFLHLKTELNLQSILVKKSHDATSKFVGMLSAELPAFLT